MILEKDFRETDVTVVGGSGESIQMGVDTENINHLMMILSSNLYQNPIGSIVREYTSNAIDANVEAKCEEPVLVKLDRDKTGNYFFEVQDFGPGLDDKDFRHIISKYGSSTKRDSNDQLGYFGLGCKSAFSYTNTFYYTCVKGGKERKYLLFKGGNGFTIDQMFETETDKRNGTTVNIPVRTYDVYRFVDEIKKQLAYFDNVYFHTPHNGDFNTGFQIFREEDFQWSTLYSGYEMHITLGRVNYPIDWSAIDMTRINIPIGLRFGLDSGIFPVPSRENLIWNDETKRIVKEKIGKVADHLVKRYNESVKEAESLAQAWPHINSHNHNVTIGNKTFDVTVLQQVSSVSFQEVKIKNLKYHRPSQYKAWCTYLVKNHRIVGNLYGNKLRTKGIYDGAESLPNNIGGNLLLADDVVITGWFREYLKTLKFTNFVKLKDLDKQKEEDLEWFQQILFLKNAPKKEWRARIKEFKEVREGFLKEILVDGTDYHTSQAFLDFREANKKKMVRKTSSNRLNKQVGDVVIAYPRPSYNNEFVYVFEKKTHKLEDLHKNHYITVFYDDDKEIDHLWQRIFIKQKVRFAKIGQQDWKKIQQLKLDNFMTIKELERTKIFSRTATAIKARKLIALYNQLASRRHDIVQACLTKFNKLKNEVEQYAKSVIHDFDEDQVQASMLVIAEQYDLWDKSFYHKLKEFERQLQDFDFIPQLREAKSTDPKEIHDRYSNLINSLLLFKKLRYEEKLPCLEVCVRNDAPIDECKDHDLVALAVESLTP